LEQLPEIFCDMVRQLRHMGYQIERGSGSFLE